MANLGQETSMEEILSSIKRVIQEGGDRGPRRGDRIDPPMGRETPLPELDPPEEDEHEVLELTDPVEPAPEAVFEPAAEFAPQPAIDDGDVGYEEPADDEPFAAGPLDPSEPPPEPAFAGVAPVNFAAGEPPVTANRPTGPLVSPSTVDASRNALASLGRLAVRDQGSDGSVEGLVRDLLKPMLAEWLDQNLPAIVERLVAAEVKRIASDNS